MKIARHRGMKRAIVAVARRLAVIMHRMWVDGTEFRWTREEAKAVRGLRHVLELIADAGSTNEAGRFSPVELHRHGAWLSGPFRAQSA
jgi:hypothetical protein